MPGGQGRPPRLTPVKGALSLLGLGASGPPRRLSAPGSGRRWGSGDRGSCSGQSWAGGTGMGAAGWDGASLAGILSDGTPCARAVPSVLHRWSYVPAGWRAPLSGGHGDLEKLRDWDSGAQGDSTPAVLRQAAVRALCPQSSADDSEWLRQRPGDLPSFSSLASSWISPVPSCPFSTPLMHTVLCGPQSSQSDP